MIHGISASKRTKKNDTILCILIIVSVLMAGYIVYLKGGTEFAFTHLMYIPIITAAFFFDIKGAVGIAFLGGVAIGPWMPVNVSEGITQTPSSWMFRTVIFIMIGLVIGFLFQHIKIDRETQIRKAYINEATGLPNASKLKIDLNKMLDKQEDISLVVFKFTNIDHINRYIDYDIGEKSVLELIKILTNLVDRDTIYSIFTNEIAVAMWGFKIKDAYLKANEFLDCFKEPILIDGVPVNLAIKCGISNYPLHGTDGKDLYKKMGRALDQEEFGEQKIAIYDDFIAQENKAKFEAVVSLYDAIKNDQFTLVYQPIINLRSNEVKSVEALLRWNNSKGLNPDEFIKIAEDADIISEITKWVITHVMNQLRKWKEEDVTTKVAINISSKDLRNDAIIEYITQGIGTQKIDPELLELELTERVIVENKKEVEKLLNRIKNLGIKISLDDFGTGYNSMVQLTSLPIDCLKIDKFFTDNIQDLHYRSLIKELIVLAHSIGQEVIAEGVETGEQMELLNDMGCDNVQGYYFSKPLPPEKLKEFINRFHKTQGTAESATGGRNAEV